LTHDNMSTYNPTDWSVYHLEECDGRAERRTSAA
jgi:hypothetical protein